MWMKVDSPQLLRFAPGGDKLKLFSVAMLSHVSDPRLIQRELRYTAIPDLREEYHPV